ncbi:MAG: sialate O-acetylesterase, partial [Clostridiaceae bacterium]|nr:sialate O-acetylesterase [Clostridiaceae bacterium]
TITATVTATNKSNAYFETPIDILLIVGLYNENNTLLDVSHSSKAIGYRGTSTLSSGIKLPSDVKGCYIKVLLWDGTDLKNTNMLPLTNAVILTEDTPASPSPSPGDSSSKNKVFILAGQSNMAGVGMNHELPSEYLGSQEKVKIYAEGTVDASLKGAWSTLRPGFGSGSGCFGPELTFGRDMAKAYPDSQIYIIKCGWSGTSLQGDWRPPSAGGTSGALWKNMLSTVDKALSALGPDFDYELSGMCWMQGESDACNIYPAKEYEGSLTAFISDVRKELNAPNLPFIIAMIDDSNVWVEHAIVRQAQIDVSEKVPYVGIFDTKDYETDGTHYKTQGILDMGSDFAQIMLEEFLQK